MEYSLLSKSNNSILPILSGLKAKVYTDNKDVSFDLDIIKETDTCIILENKEYNANFSLTLENENGFISLYANGTYYPKSLNGNNFGYHFSPECALELNFENVNHLSNFVANFQKCEFWCHTAFSENPGILPDRIQGLLAKNNDEFIYFLPVTDKIYRSNQQPRSIREFQCSANIVNQQTGFAWHRAEQGNQK